MSENRNEAILNRARQMIEFQERYSHQQKADRKDFFGLVQMIQAGIPHLPKELSDLLEIYRKTEIYMKLAGRDVASGKIPSFETRVQIVRLTEMAIANVLEIANIHGLKELDEDEREKKIKKFEDGISAFRKDLSSSQQTMMSSMKPDTVGMLLDQYANFVRVYVNDALGRFTSPGPEETMEKFADILIKRMGGRKVEEEEKHRAREE